MESQPQNSEQGDCTIYLNVYLITFVGENPNKQHCHLGEPIFL